MLLPVALLARTDEDGLIVRSTSSRVYALLSGIENMKALFGMDEEEQHS